MKKHLKLILYILITSCSYHAQGQPGEQKVLFSKTFDYPMVDKENVFIVAPAKGRNMVIDYISIYTNYNAWPKLVYRNNFELPFFNLFSPVNGKDKNYSERVQYVILDGEQMMIKVNNANEREIIRIYVAGHEIVK